MSGERTRGPSQAGPSELRSRGPARSLAGFLRAVTLLSVFKSVSANLLAAGRSRRSRSNLRVLGQFFLVLANQLLGVVRAVERLAFGVVSRTGMVPTNDEMGATEVLSN